MYKYFYLFAKRTTFIKLHPFVEGEKLWLDQGPFDDRTNTTTELPSHPVISPTTFHLKPTPLTHFPRHFKFVNEFPVGKSTNFLYPSTKDIQTKPPLHSGLFMLRAICNR